MFPRKLMFNTAILKHLSPGFTNFSYRIIEAWISFTIFYNFCKNYALIKISTASSEVNTPYYKYGSICMKLHFKWQQQHSAKSKSKVTNRRKHAFIFPLIQMKTGNLRRWMTKHVLEGVGCNISTRKQETQTCDNNMSNNNVLFWRFTSLRCSPSGLWLSSDQNPCCIFPMMIVWKQRKSSLNHSFVTKECMSESLPKKTRFQCFSHFSLCGL